MKKILTLLLLFIASLSYSKDTTTVIPDSSKLTFLKVYNDVKSGISGLASGLKTTAEHVYVVLVKQQIVLSISYLILIIISLIFIFNWFRAYKKDEEVWHDGNSPTGLGFLRTFQIMVFSVFLFISMTHIDNIVTGFINPEYGAIKEILEIIK